MKTYKCDFVGRKINAIGITYTISLEIEAENERDAEIKLYDNFDHISRLSLKSTHDEVQNVAGGIL